MPLGDSPALARAIQQLLANPELAARLAQAGRQLVCRRFSMDAMVQATEHLYHSLLEKRRRVPTGTPVELACK